MSDDQKGTSTPKNWWQWILLYPTFTIALLGAAPQYTTLIKSWYYDVPAAQVAQGEEQATLWAKNFDCAKDLTPHIVKTKTNAELKVGGCRTGDILVEVYPPDPSIDPIKRWISFDRLKTTLSFQFIDSAYANGGPEQMLLAQNNYVLCQRWLNNQTLIRRVRANNGCYDETINVHSGRVISRVRVTCDSSCR